MGGDGCGRKKKDECKNCNYEVGKAFDICTFLYHQCSDNKGSENRKFTVDRISFWVKPRKCYDVYYLLDKLSQKICKHWADQSVKGKKCDWKKRKEYKEKGDHFDNIYWIDDNPSVEWLACRILRDLRKYYGGVVSVVIHTTCGYEARAVASYQDHCESYSDPESYASECHPCKPCKKDYVV